MYILFQIGNNSIIIHTALLILDVSQDDLLCHLTSQ